MTSPMEDEHVDHPILHRAFEFRIVGLRLELEPEDGSESFIDVTLQKNRERRRLRFWSPQDIEIERGGPYSSGFSIYDIRSRGWERIGVQVDDFEASSGSLRFYARSVIDLDAAPADSPPARDQQ